MNRLELLFGLLLVGLFVYLYLKARKQNRGMRDRRRKILDRYRNMDDGNESNDN